MDSKVNTSEEQVVQTIKIPLRTSNKKMEKVKETIEEYNNFKSYYSDILPSFNQSDVSTMNTTFYRRGREEFNNMQSKSNVLLEAIEDVVASYDSWVSRGKDGDMPIFDDGNYFRIKSSDVTIEENDKGYGMKCSFIPYNPLWFKVKNNPFVDEYLQKIVNDEASFGTCELHLDDGLYAHLVVKWDVEVYQSESTDDRVLGVDLGEKNIFTTTFLDENGFSDVHIESGEEFRHHREQLKKKRKEMMAKDDLRSIKKCSGDHERYTEYIIDYCSRSIVDQAKELEPCKIVIEDLTHYRETAHNAIHNWPFALLQEKIAYKAKAAGIPVETIDPRNTSKTCRVCGHVHSSNRNGDDFECGECGYQVHADVNGAMNIAMKGSKYSHEDFDVTQDKEFERSLFDV